MSDTFGGATPPAGGGSAGTNGLPPSLTRGITALSGMDLSDVKEHRNSPKPATVDALAFAQDGQIHLAPGQEKHLPHEAWHIVQQRQGRVKTSRQDKGVDINDEPGLEKEATLMGERALRGNEALAPPWSPSKQPMGTTAATLAQSRSIMQCQLRTVQSKTHARDENLEKKGKEYKSGAMVDVDESHIVQDERGNGIWYKIIGEDSYIRATKLAMGTVVNKALSKEEENTLNKDNVANLRKMLQMSEFVRPVHGKPAKSTMPDIEGRDAQNNKGFLTDDEVQVIHRLSESPTGQKFLAQYGFLNTAEVQKWAESPFIAGSWERYEEYGYKDPASSRQG